MHCFMWQLICKLVRGWEEEDKEVVREMKWKIIKCGCFVDFLVGRLTCIAHRQIEEALSFQNLYFLPSKSKYSQFYGLLSFLYVSFSICFILQENALWEIVELCWKFRGHIDQGCLMHILTTLQYFILLLYRDKAQVSETMTQVKYQGGGGD